MLAPDGKVHPGYLNISKLNFSEDGGFGDLLGPQNAMSTGSSTGGFGQNMMAPQGKMDFSAKGPNPIQVGLLPFRITK